MDLEFNQNSKKQFLDKLKRQKKERQGNNQQKQACKKIQAYFRNSRNSDAKKQLENLCNKLNDVNVLFKKIEVQQQEIVSIGIFDKFPGLLKSIFYFNKYNCYSYQKQIATLLRLFNLQYQASQQNPENNQTLYKQTNLIASNQKLDKQKGYRAIFYLSKLAYLGTLILKDKNFDINLQEYLLEQYNQFIENLNKQNNKIQQSLLVQSGSLHYFYFYRLLDKKLLADILSQNEFIKNNVYENCRLNDKQNLSNENQQQNKMDEEKNEHNYYKQLRGFRYILQIHIQDEIRNQNQQKKQLQKDAMEEEKNDDYFKKQKLQLSEKFLLLPQCLEIKNSIYFILKNNQELIGKMFQLILKNFQEYLEQQQQKFNLFKKSFKEIDKYMQQNITNIQAKTLINLVQLWKLYIDQRSNNKNNSEYNIEDIPQFLNLFVLTLEKYNYNITCIIQEELKEVQKQNEENMDQNELDDQYTKYILEESNKIYEDELYTQSYQEIDFSVFFQKNTVDVLSQFLSDFMKNNIYQQSDLDKIHLLSKFYLTVLNIKSINSLQFLIQLQSQNNMIENLWGIIGKIGTNLKNIAFKKQQMGSIIAFFTRIYNQRVEMLDDREFFNDDEIFQIKQSELDINSKNFSIDEVKKIASFLNNYVYQLIFLEQIQELQISKNTSVQLLKELYNRDQRKQYCQKNFWVIEQADTNINNNNFFSLIQQQQLQMNQNQLQQIQQQQHKDLFQQIINEIPHIFSFEKRHKYFNQMRSEDHLKQGPNRDPLQFYQINFNMFNGQEDDEDQLQLNMNHERVIQVVRGEEFEVGYDKMINANLKHLYKIQYQNEHGIAEAGIDGGGLQKEFITNIINYALNPQNGFFVETGDKTLIPNKENGDLSLYYYIGKIVGKAIYEDILIEPIFSPIFLNQILGKKNNIEELYYLDKDQYKSLMYLKHMKDDILDLDLNFSIDEQHRNKQSGQFETKKIELKPQGDSIPVTNENKLEYIMLYADYKLNKSTQKQVKAFRDGFTQTVNQQWLMMFNHEELQLLISGNFQKFDIQDLKNNTVYNGYNANDQTIKEFWEVLQEFTIEQKKQLLYFVTSCSRPPTLGFKSLEPKFSIQISIGPNYQQNLDKLPTSSTCMNILKLPNYKNKQKLKEKLITAISSKSGFDLT